MTELLTTAEVAVASRRCEDTVLLAARRGLLTSQQAGPRASRFYRRRDVQAWIDRGAPYRTTAHLRAVS